MDIKKIRLFAALLMVAFVATSCINWVDDDGNNNSSSGGSNSLKKGQIEMKVYPNGNRVSFSVTTDKITIDWGDGKIDKLSPNGVKQTFSHTFANNNLQTIYIESEKLVQFRRDYYDSGGTFKELYFGEMNELEILNASSSVTVLEIKKANALKELDCYSNQLTSLNVSGCTALTSLNCSSNQLTSLNVSGCTALRWLSCGYNQLTSSVLNSLFESLPNRPAKSGFIIIDSNPGTYGCNRAIAENKGWSFWG
jgi:Leucine-rich repeat (LRR) protein